MFHVSFTCGVIHSPVAWLTHVWHDTFTCNMIHSRVEWHIHTSHASFIPSQNKKVTRQLTIIFVYSHTYICLPASMHFFIVWLFFPDKGNGCTGYGPYGTWLIHLWHDFLRCDMTPLGATWLIHVQHDSFTRDMTHSCVQHDLFTCNMTHARVTWPMYAWQDSIVCHWLIHMWNDSFVYDTTHSRVTWAR